MTNDLQVHTDRIDCPAGHHSDQVQLPPEFCHSGEVHLQNPVNYGTL